MYEQSKLVRFMLFLYIFYSYDMNFRSLDSSWNLYSVLAIVEYHFVVEVNRFDGTNRFLVVFGRNNQCLILRFVRCDNDTFVLFI